MHPVAPRVLVGVEFGVEFFGIAAALVSPKPTDCFILHTGEDNTLLTNINNTITRGYRNSTTAYSDPVDCLVVSI